MHDLTSSPVSQIEASAAAIAEPIRGLAAKCGPKIQRLFKRHPMRRAVTEEQSATA